MKLEFKSPSIGKESKRSSSFNRYSNLRSYNGANDNSHNKENEEEEDQPYFAGCEVSPHQMPERLNYQDDKGSVYTAYLTGSSNREEN